MVPKASFEIHSGHATRRIGIHTQRPRSLEARPACRHLPKPATASSVEAYSLHANNSPLDEYCLIKIELILKYTLPTSSFINNYSLGGFVVPFDNFNLYEAIFTRVDLRPPRQTALSFWGRECIPGRAKTSLSRRDITPYGHW